MVRREGPREGAGAEEREGADALALGADRGAELGALARGAERGAGRGLTRGWLRGEGALRTAGSRDGREGAEPADGARSG
ncbi:MAG TPA: hypothetical protein VFQ22_04835 [Longimicrobiales bacterium]|nr:hypothetical protein [Longimicrobiales bacterium]